MFLPVEQRFARKWDLLIWKMRSARRDNRGCCTWIPPLLLLWDSTTCGMRTRQLSRITELQLLPAAATSVPRQMVYRPAEDNHGPSQAAPYKFGWQTCRSPMSPKVWTDQITT